MRVLSQAKADEYARDAAGDLLILSGQALGPSDVTWQDVAGTCAINLHGLADAIMQSRDGSVDVSAVLAALLDTLQDH